MTIAAGRTRGGAGADIFFSSILHLSFPLLELPRHCRYYRRAFDYRVYSELESAVNKSATSHPVWRVIVRFYHRTSVGSHYSIALLSVKKKQKKKQAQTGLIARGHSSKG